MTPLDICFVVMPFGSVRRPAIGASLLKSGLREAGISSKIYYFNLKFAERISLEIYERLSETSLDSPLIGELIFAGFAFRRQQWKKNDIKNILHQILESRHQSISYLEEITNEIIDVAESIPEFLDDCAYNILQQRPK